MTDPVEQLLISIARCPECRRLVEAPDTSAPCNRVVQAQPGIPTPQHHLPEPWNGDLAGAPLLFVSSNPSISKMERFPNWSWPDPDIVRFFHDRLEGSFIDGAVPRVEPGDPPRKAVRYLQEVRSMARALFGRPVRPGRDYAITEVVHCKSARKVGVREARAACAGRYLDPVLQASGARVIAVLGLDAASVLAHHLQHPEFGTRAPGGEHLITAAIGGRTRVLIALGAPNSALPRQPKRVLTTSELAAVRAELDVAPASA